ncbi:MAG: hypothetical protein KTQ49_02705 [Candidatus Omnitrophica bacterium]|nr:hypothetical protein [Candidatus Omnitrophota bacterium]
MLKKVVLTLAVLGAIPAGVRADEPMLKTLSAHVVEVEANGTALDVDFKHPASGEVRRLTFVMDGASGLSGIDELRDLRAGQVVSIDYVENSQGDLCIRRIARVKLSGPPPGLEHFRGL